MPTKRPRLTVTETPEIERRLDRAALAFPELAGRRKQLLLRLTELGERALANREARAGDPKAAAKRRIADRTQRITSSEAEAILAARDEDWNDHLDLRPEH